MKKVIYILGAIAAAFMTLGIGLFILAGWGSLVEYHAFEWRGVQPAGASPLVMATNDLSLWCLGIGFITGVITFALLFTTAIRNARKAQQEHFNRLKSLPRKEER